MANTSIDSLAPIFARWWSGITDAANDGRNADRGSIAELRRIDLVDDGDGDQPDVTLAMTNELYRRIYRWIGESGARLPTGWEADLVTAAVTLAHIRKNAGAKTTTAALLGGAEDKDRAMKEGRFLRLMRAATAGDLFDQARRLAKLLNNEAPVGELGASLLLWRHVPAIRRNWARSYYHLDQDNRETPTLPGSIDAETGATFQ